MDAASILYITMDIFLFRLSSSRGAHNSHVLVPNPIEYGGVVEEVTERAC